MSWPELSVRRHKRQTDFAIQRAFRQLAANPRAAQQFQELLHCARERAPRLFEAPVISGCHLGVDALANLSRFHHAHLRQPTAWAGTTSSWRPAIASLAHHLISRYTVPAFLAAAWYASDSVADQKRNWFIAHSRGASFRSLDLPIEMTRKMERIFLASEDHLQIEYALRKAELQALGTPPEFVKEILSTRLATDLRHGEFWRTFWLFLTANAEELDPAQIAPMIDYIDTVRHDRMPVEMRDGTRELDPPLPSFSMKGRTVQSMMRLMHDWHRSLRGTGEGFSWMRSPFRSFVFEETSHDDSAMQKRWCLMELTSSAQLRSEGAALRHCVASYASRCYRGSSSIWSLRLWRGEKIRHVLTIEVDPRRRTVIQARGIANRPAAGKPLWLLRDWASRERLKLEI